MPTESKTIAAESGHWYDREGNPRYTIIGKNGAERATTVRDAKKLDLVPSVTTVMSVYPRWGLIQWQKRQVLLSALTLPVQHDSETHDEYIDRIMKDADEQALKAREKGTGIHGGIERYLTGEVVEEELMVYVSSALDALRTYLGLSESEPIELLSEAEKSFASDWGYGGKVDLHSRSLNFVCDFKTKEFDQKTNKLAWDEHRIQLEAYRQGLGMPDARMLNVFVSTSVPGLATVVEHEDGDTWAWDVFQDCLKLFKTIKRMNIPLKAIKPQKSKVWVNK
jgi:hypothetical protein